LAVSITLLTRPEKATVGLATLTGDTDGYNFVSIFDPATGKTVTGRNSPTLPTDLGQRKGHTRESTLGYVIKVVF
jgi:hypothetical protein